MAAKRKPARTSAKTGGTRRPGRTRAAPSVSRAAMERHRAQAHRARSSASLKGWETRRANARAAERAERREARKRSEASRKGWETRRANERKRKRGGRVGKPPPEKARFAVSADYKSRRAGSAVTIQISAIGPANATRDDAEAATAYKINYGRSPRGWQIRIINWRGPEWTGEPIEPDQKIADAWHTLSTPLALAELKISPVGDRES